MKKSDLGPMITILANIGVIAGIVFLAVELRQNTIASRSAAFQALGVATAETWFGFSENREVSDAIWAVDEGGAEAFQSLTPSDRYLVRNVVIGWLRLFETTYIQVEQGLLEPDAMETLGYRGFLDSVLLETTWQEVKGFVTPAFGQYIESSQRN